MVGTNVRVRELRRTLGEVNCICAGRCEKPRRGILLQDASFQITWQPQWSPATTLIPMSWTHPGGVSLLINLNNIQCVRCKKCVSSLIYWVRIKTVVLMTPDLANDHELNLDSSSAIWLFLYEIALLTNIVVECAKNVQTGFPNNMHSLFSAAAPWAGWWRCPRPGCRPTGSASPRSASRRSCTAGTTSPPPPRMRRTGRTSKVSCEPSVSTSQVMALHNLCAGRHCPCCCSSPAPATRPSFLDYSLTNLSGNKYKYTSY